MSFRYLLDTNALSEPIKPVRNLAAVRQIERYRTEIVTAAPAWHELLYGCFRLPPSARRDKLDNLVLVTRNVSDYEYFEGLAVENWSA